MYENRAHTPAGRGSRCAAGTASSAGTPEQCRRRPEKIEAALDGIFELPLGGTAAGTGLNAPKEFGRRTIEIIACETGLPFGRRRIISRRRAKDAAAPERGAARTARSGLPRSRMTFAGWLRTALRVGRAALTGTSAGLQHDARKVNPVIAESALMVCAQVIGHDAAIAWCCAAGNFELNAMSAVDRVRSAGFDRIIERRGGESAEPVHPRMEADRARALWYTGQSLALVTALVPEIGYERASAIAQEAYRSGRTILEVSREKSGLPEKIRCGGC